MSEMTVIIVRVKKSNLTHLDAEVRDERHQHPEPKGVEQRRDPACDEGRYECLDEVRDSASIGVRVAVIGPQGLLAAPVAAVLQQSY